MIGRLVEIIEELGDDELDNLESDPDKDNLTATITATGTTASLLIPATQRRRTPKRHGFTTTSA